MTNDQRSSKHQGRSAKGKGLHLACFALRNSSCFGHSCFDLRPSLVIGHWKFVLLWSFVIRNSSFFGHWSLEIRHSCPALEPITKEKPPCGQAPLPFGS